VLRGFLEQGCEDKEHGYYFNQVQLEKTNKEGSGKLLLRPFISIVFSLCLLLLLNKHADQYFSLLSPTRPSTCFSCDTPRENTTLTRKDQFSELQNPRSHHSNPIEMKEKWPQPITSALLEINCSTEAALE
jgi:hypothetical protein